MDPRKKREPSHYTVKGVNDGVLGETSRQETVEYGGLDLQRQSRRGIGALRLRSELGLGVGTKKERK